MKKKFFIIFGVILILISAFQNKIFAYNPVIDGAREYMSDMLEDMQNNGEISQELYEDLQKQANTELTKAEMTQQLKENLFFFAVGQYANISQDIVADTLLSLSDIWDYIFWDNSTQSFGFDNDIGDFIKNGLDDLIYTYHGGTVGNWVALPVGITTVGSHTVLAICENSSGSDIYMCRVGNNYLIAFRGSGVQTMKITDKPSNYVHYISFGQGSNGSAYTGSLYSGYYYPNSGLYPIQPSVTAYSSNSVALSDFFGLEIENGEGVLHDAIIVNENPVFPTLSPLGALNPNYKNIVINNYNNGISYPPNSGLNVNYYDYDYNYDVPFWEGAELETIAYPDEIDFPSVEFETVVVDQNIDSAIEGLSGWIIEFLLIAILLLVLGLII